MGDFEAGREAMEKEAARKDAGRDRADDTASDFDAGWAAGREASDPNSPTTSRDVVDRVRREYRDLDAAQRAAYREGYAAGANRNR